MQRLTIPIICSIFLLGCVHSHIAKERELLVPLGENVEFELLAPKTYGKNVSITQVAQINSGGENYELLFRTQIIDNELLVVGLLPNGTHMFSIKFNGVNITKEGREDIIKNIRPKYLLADIQLSMWPYKMLVDLRFTRTHCSEKTTCYFTQKSDPERRELTVLNKKIISISYSPAVNGNANILYEHFLRKYAIKLETLEIVGLD